MKMKEKISRKELKGKVESIKGLVDDIINERIDIPNNAFESLLGHGAGIRCRLGLQSITPQ